MGKTDGSPDKEKEKPTARPPGKDIRAFFAPKTGASKAVQPAAAPAAATKAAPKAKAEPVAAAGKQPTDEPPAKKSKYFAEDGAKPAATPRGGAKQPAAPPPAPKQTPSKASGGSQRQQPAASGSARKKQPAAAVGHKRRQAVISDGDDDDDDVVKVEEEVTAVPGKGKAAARAGAGAAAIAPTAAAAAGKGGKGKASRVVIDDDEDEDGDYIDIDEDSDDSDDVELVEDDGDDEEDFVVKKQGKGGKQATAAASRAGGAGGGKKAAAAAAPAAAAGAKRAREEPTPAPAPAPAAVPRPSGRKLPASMAHASPAAAPAPSPTAGKGKTAPAPPSAAAGRGKASGGKAGAGAFDLDEPARKAIAAVDEAAKHLPPEEEVKFSKMPEGQDAAGNEAAVPLNYENKETPLGHPDCLTGKTFVISGVLDSLMRPQAEDLIKRHGGKVTSAVSGKTSFLLAGMDCGRSKTRGAREKGTKIIDEDGLFSLICASQPFMQAAPAQAPGGAGAGGAAAPGGGAPRPATIPAGSFFGSGAAAQRPIGGAAAAAGAAGGVGGGGAGGSSSSDGQLWVDKYKPHSSAELVGNTGLVQTLRQWLQSWEQTHLHGGAAPKQGGGAKPKDLGKKAVLLSGPPGIGKTSAAHIIARECGYDIVEVNASDTRNKAGKVSEGMAGKTSNVIKEAVNNTTLLAGLGPGAKQRKQLIIMDEVDGMSGGDRGGVADLIQSIAKTKVPIVCICNDKYNQKLRSLRNHCLELEFRKPTALQISNRIAGICRDEGLNINQATLEALITGAGGDLRLVLGQLQMVRLRKVALSYDEVKGRLGTSKDADMSPFECARKLLEPTSAHLTMSARLELVFADMDLVPLLVQENYLNHRPVIALNDPSGCLRLRAIAKAADAISSGDTVNNVLRRSQAWGLMPFAGVMSSLLPSAYMRGSRETFNLYPNEMNFPRFTAWLGNYSNGNKQRRLLGELTTTLAASGAVSAARGAVRLEYASALRTLLTAPLRQHAEEAIQPTVDLMREYCISREQFDYVLDVTQFKSKAPWAEDPFKEVPAKVKAAFTRTFNQQGGVAVKCNLQVDEVKTGRGKGRAKGKGASAGGADDEEDPFGKEEDGAPPPEEEEEEEDAAVLASRLAKDGVDVQVKGGSGAAGKKSAGRGGRASGGASRASGGRGAGKKGK